jgi:hypothetical protein
MEWHINDLSLDGQFSDPQAFRSALEPLLKLRSRDPLLRGCFYCSHMLHACKVTAIDDVKSAVFATRDKTYIRLALEWSSGSGPFWDDERQLNADDYFEYQGTDVTDQGLGEAARRSLAGKEANTFSFQLPRFSVSPLTVQQGLAIEPLAFIDVVNHWTIAQLEQAIESCRAFNSWHDVQVEINRRFDQLILSANVMDALMATPFSKYAADRIFILLGILNQLVVETNENGQLSEIGIALHNDFFVGDKALFTDESDRNKAKFAREMTFSDPRDASKRIFCPFHGKIKSPQLRIHFEWPIPSRQREMKVVYIGPKITKG